MQFTERNAKRLSLMLPSLSAAAVTYYVVYEILRNHWQTLGLPTGTSRLGSHPDQKRPRFTMHNFGPFKPRFLDKRQTTLEKVDSFENWYSTTSFSTVQAIAENFAH